MTATTTDVSIASFNVHAGIDGWGRGYDAVAACLALDADVLVIPESWRGDDPSESIADRVAELGGYSGIHTPGGRARRRRAENGVVQPASWGPRFAAWRMPPIQFEAGGARREPGLASQMSSTSGVWLMSLLTRLPVLRQELVALPQLGHDSARRHAIVAELGVGSARLTVIAAHLGHLLHGSVRQIRRLREVLDELEGPRALVGDFNCWGGPLRVLLPSLTDAVTGATWPAWRPHSRIDHILVPRSLQVSRASVQPAAGSDHRPVRCVVSIAQPS